VKIFGGIVLTLAIALVLAWAVGVRIFVIQPIGAIPEGVTVIVYGVPGLNFIDSPDAFCQRHQGGVNLLCRGMAAGTVAKNGTILLRLPYMSILYAMSGAPEVDR
jgi:hypothetical protein